MFSAWQGCIPDSLLLDIFSYLDVTSLGRVAQACHTWFRVSRDELLWQGVARRSLKIKGPLAPGKSTWLDEVKRLVYHVPTVCVETIHGHTDEVLDVAISHDGQYFCTSSRDAHIVMWKLDGTSKSTIVSDFNAGHYLRWQLSQYSIFNPDDSLVLNCGVKSYHDIPEDEDADFLTGIGAVFTVPDLVLVSLVEMDPPTMFGAWLNESTYISGLRGTIPDTFNIQAYKVMYCVGLNIVRKDQIKQLLSAEEATPLDVLTFIYEKNCDTLFTFCGSYNHLMNLLVANVPNTCVPNSSATTCDNVLFDPYSSNDYLPSCLERSSESSRSFEGQVESHRRKRSIEEPAKCKVKIKEFAEGVSSKESRHSEIENDLCSASDCTDRLSSADKGDEYDIEEDGLSIGVRTPSCYRNSQFTQEQSENWNVPRNYSSNTEIDKKLYIAFVTGNHDKIAVHDVTKKPADINNDNAEKSSAVNEAGDGAEHKVDTMDHVFTLKHCYITGLCLSHDHRHLYFNYRELDKKSTVNDMDSDEDFEDLPTQLKIFCKQLKIGSIDLVTMTRMADIEFSGHVGYSSWPAWYICLDASPDYVGSGSEDMRGYVWDRHYGICVGILSHSSLDTGDVTFDVMSELMDNSQSNVVNGLAFCPTDQEICITVCDDKLIKVWKSKNRMKQAERIRVDSDYSES